jgi:RecB family exonuclease
MQVTRLSASALNTAMNCLARFKAEYVDRGRGLQGAAATFGTAVHAALEMYVKGAYLDTKLPREWATLRDIWSMQHTLHYNGLHDDPAEFKLGEKILKAWFDRADLEQPDRTVISTELKESFKITISGVEIEFVYIWDRCDRKADGSIVVVDYKTSAWGVSSDELRTKVQPRLYALAAQIKWPDAPGIWVEFDMLKHDNQPTGAYFRREDNAATFEALKKESQEDLRRPGRSAADL